MFTGIIQSVGTIADMQQRGGDLRVLVDTGTLDLGDSQVGDSIAVSGVCLTATSLGAHEFRADVSTETLSRTVLGKLAVNTRVNLEKALTLSTPLGGHLVSGHVDGIGTVQRRAESGRAILFTIEAPAELARYIAVKGSVCVDGISLTVNAVRGCQFDLTIVPHTLEQTTMNEFQPGREVNLEVDIVARYLERLLLGDKAADESADGTISLDTLRQAGFIETSPS